MGRLIQLLDRPIAYQPAYANLKSGKVRTGPVAAVFLSQMVYWHNRMNGEWMYKTQAEIREETSLTRDEQETARKRLVALGILEEQLRGVPATMHYRVNAERLEALLLGEAESSEESQIAATPQTRMRQPRKLDRGNATNKHAGTPQTSQRQSPEQACGDPTNFLTGDYTESTHKTTQDIYHRESAGKKSRTAKPDNKHTLPEDFSPTEKHQVLANELGVDLQEEFLKFADHHASKGSKFVDWGRALNNWLRNAKGYQRGSQRTQTPQKPNHSPIQKCGDYYYIDR